MLELIPAILISFSILIATSTYAYYILQLLKHIERMTNAIARTKIAPTSALVNGQPMGPAASVTRITFPTSMKAGPPPIPPVVRMEEDI